MKKQSRCILTTLFKAIFFICLGLSSSHAIGQVADHVARDLQLVGTLGDKASGKTMAIEMELIGNGEDAFLATQNARVYGRYHYVSQMQPILLKGAYDPADGSLLLTADDNYGAGNETERFRGHWNNEKQVFEGIWTLKSTEKTLPFEIGPSISRQDSNHLPAFYQLLREQIQVQADADSEEDAATIDDAKWEDGQGKIFGFRCNWDCFTFVFSPMRLQYSTSYRSSVRNSNHDHVYQLLSSDDGAYVLHFQKTSAYYRGYDDAHPENDFSCSCGFSVYNLNDDAFEDVTESVFPKGASYGGSAEKEKDSENCSGTVLRDGIRLGNGQRYLWDGHQFLLQRKR